MFSKRLGDFAQVGVEEATVIKARDGLLAERAVGGGHVDELHAEVVSEHEGRAEPVGVVQGLGGKGGGRGG